MKRFCQAYEKIFVERKIIKYVKYFIRQKKRSQKIEEMMIGKNVK